jgi:hypothetical protein
MSSIRSASSRTRIRIVSSETSRRSWRSCRRPGAELLDGTDARELVGDLERELAGGDEDERSGRRRVGRHALDDRQAEGESLAGARRRLRQHVVAGKGVRDGERLDRECLDDAARRELLLDARADAERTKRLGHLVFHSFCCGLETRLETHEGGTRSLSHGTTGLPSVQTP